jgi:hypothetical protein
MHEKSEGRRKAGRVKLLILYYLRKGEVIGRLSVKMSKIYVSSLF